MGYFAESTRSEFPSLHWHLTAPISSSNKFHCCFHVVFLLSFNDRYSSLIQHSSISSMSALVTSNLLSAPLCFTFRSLMNLKARAVTHRRHSRQIMFCTQWWYSARQIDHPQLMQRGLQPVLPVQSLAFISGRHSSGSNSLSNLFGLPGPSESVSHFGPFHHKVCSCQITTTHPPGEYVRWVVWSKTMVAALCRYQLPYHMDTVLHKLFPLLYTCARTLYNQYQANFETVQHTNLLIFISEVRASLTMGISLARTTASGNSKHGMVWLERGTTLVFEATNLM